jgi:hypothetical protein
VLSAVESDPGRVAAAVQPEFDPDPSDVASDVDSLRTDVDSLRSDLDDLTSSVQAMCSDLESSDALSDVALTCP